MSRKAIDTIVREQADAQRRNGKEPRVEEIRKRVVQTALRNDAKKGRSSGREQQ